MSRPLELTIHPKRFVTTGFVRVNGDGTHTDLHVPEWFIDGQWNRFPRTEDKRLTDAELAAEFQNSRLVSYVRQKRAHNYPGDMALFDHYERGLEQEWTLERFATLPHYDEQP